MLLDCPSCDIEPLNPSNPTRIMEKCSSKYCPSNDQKTDLYWELYELRKEGEFGKPKLEKIFCTESDQTSLPWSNSKLKLITGPFCTTNGYFFQIIFHYTQTNIARIARSIYSGDVFIDIRFYPKLNNEPASHQL
jgi:hypothetical protein